MIESFQKDPLLCSCGSLMKCEYTYDPFEGGTPNAVSYTHLDKKIIAKIDGTTKNSFLDGIIGNVSDLASIIKRADIVDVVIKDVYKRQVLDTVENDWKVEINRRPGDEAILAQGKVD